MIITRGRGWFQGGSRPRWKPGLEGSIPSVSSNARGCGNALPCRGIVEGDYASHADERDYRADTYASYAGEEDKAQREGDTDIHAIDDVLHRPYRKREKISKGLHDAITGIGYQAHRER